MLSCSIWFSAPSMWMGGGLESHCICRVYGADGVMHHPHRTRDPRSSSQDHHPSKNSVQKTICCDSASDAPDDGCMYPKHVELEIYRVTQKERMFLKWVVAGRVSFFGVTSNQKSTFENLVQSTI